MSSLWAGCLLGALLGARHATEPDHLAAVATLAVRVQSPWRGAFLGGVWGLGHTLALLAFGGVLVLLGRALPAQVSHTLEGLVGILLIGLGVAALRSAFAEGRPGPRSGHGHGQLRRPMLVGFAHGLAGSGALSAAVLAGLPSNALRLLYMAAFGLGSALGMAVLSCGLAMPFARALRLPRLRVVLSAIAGAVSVGLGLFWSGSAAWDLCH